MLGADYYELLSVPNAATQEEIRKAYRKQALRWHPDRNGGTVAATEHFSQIAEAYEALSDPAKRRIYDLFGEGGLKEGVAEDPPASSHGHRSKRSGSTGYSNRSHPTPPPPQNYSRSRSNVNESPRYNYRARSGYTDDSDQASQAEAPSPFPRPSTRRNRHRDSTVPYGEISPQIYLWALYTSNLENQHARRPPFTTPQRSDSDFMSLSGVMDLFPSPPRSWLRTNLSKFRIKGKSTQAVNDITFTGTKPSRMHRFISKLRFDNANNDHGNNFINESEFNAARAPSERSHLGRVFYKLRATKASRGSI